MQKRLIPTFTMPAWVRPFMARVGQFAVGLACVSTVFLAYTVGSFFMCTVLGFARVHEDMVPWCTWCWVLGMATLWSPVWATALGNLIIVFIKEA